MAKKNKITIEFTQNVDGKTKGDKMEVSKDLSKLFIRLGRAKLVEEKTSKRIPKPNSDVKKATTKKKESTKK